MESEYEKLAVYFADVLAASAYDLLSKKGRQLSICETALESFQAGRLIIARPSRNLGVQERFKNILEKFQEQK